MDLGLSAFARGSLILGFTLPSLSEIEDAQGGQKSLLGEQDPLYLAARQAMHTIGIVKKHVADDTLEQLLEEVPDARVRDTALTAVKNLAPTGKQGVTAVNISGRQVGMELDSPGLTPTLREKIQKQLERPVLLKGEEVIFIADVREIDLDAHRFELRHIENQEVNDVRCSYVEIPDNEARG